MPDDGCDECRFSALLLKYTLAEGTWGPLDDDFWWFTDFLIRTDREIT